MQDKRTIMAFVLIAILAMLMMRQSAQREAQRRAEEEKRAAQEGAKEAVARKSAEPAEKGPGRQPTEVISAAGKRPAATPKKEPPPDREAEKIEAAAREPEPELDDNIRTKTNKYTLIWTNRGAALKVAKLSEPKKEGSSEPKYGEYSRDKKAEKPVRILAPTPDGRLSLALRNMTDNTPAFDSRNYKVIHKPEYGLVPEEGDDLIFQQKFGDLEVTKRFRFYPDKYYIDVEIRLKNRGKKTVDAAYEIAGGAAILPEFPEDAKTYVKALIGFGADKANIDVGAETAAGLDKQSEEEKADAEANRKGAPIRWSGCANKYFAAVLEVAAGKSEKGKRKRQISEVSLDRIDSAPRWAVELPAGDPESEGREGESVYSVGAGLRTTTKKLEGGEEIVDHYRFFIIPKRQQVLAEYPELRDLVDYGWFGSVSRILLSILKFFYRLIPNYGVAIILLTVVVRLVLHPLSRKSQKSMHKMQKLQPLMNELKEKYKHDKQRMSQEQMALWREHGANPLGGCLPILLQLPVFIGLFRALQLSIDLRRQPFTLWMDDLSRPDQLGTLMGMPVRALVILMIVAWFVQMKTMPKPPDPEAQKQQKIMMILPLVFGYIMRNMASGLILYWTFSMGLGIVEQKMIRASIERAEGEEPEPPDRPAAAEKRPSGRGKRKRRPRRGR